MEFDIQNGSELLNRVEYAKLSKEDRKKYNAAVKVFIDSFNAKYPQGKAVKAVIERISEGERVNVIVKKNVDLSTVVFSFPYSVTDAIAQNLGLGTTQGLVSIMHSALEPQEVHLTVKAVNVGDTYIKNDGSVGEYALPAMVKIEGTREEIVLSDDARDILSDIHTEILKDSIKESARSKRRGKKTAAPVAVTSDGGDADDDDTEV